MPQNKEAAKTNEVEPYIFLSLRAWNGEIAAYDKVYYFTARIDRRLQS